MSHRRSHLVSSPHPTYNPARSQGRPTRAVGPGRQGDTHARNRTDMARLRGNVKWFDTEKGWGFIKLEDGDEVFVHHSDIQGEGFRSLKDGAEVELEVERADRGPRARNVVSIGTEARSPDSGTPETQAPRRTAGGGRGDRSRGRSRERSASSGRKSESGPAVGRDVSGSAGSGSGFRTLDEQVRDRLAPRFRFDS